MTFGSFSGLCFASLCLARILLLFEAFASGFHLQDFEMISERVQTSVYLAIVFFFVYVFLFFFGGLEKKVVFYGFQRWRSAVFLACVSQAFGTNFGTNPAAVWGFRKRFSKARFRDDFGASPDERLPGYSIFFNGIFSYSIFFNGIFISVYVFLAMSEGSRLVFYGLKVTFGSFSGLCFASLWHESCCCLRLSQAVFQGQISRWFRSESRRAFTWL